MIERYHLGLALPAVLAGVVVVVLDRVWRRTSSHAVALAAATGAVLGSWDNRRGLLWVIPAVVIVALSDDVERSHPLDRCCLPLVVVTLVGVWAGVPDTEPPLAAAAALLPITVAHTRRGRMPGPAATLSVVVAVAGAVWVGSAGWGAALASVGALGLIATAPLAMGFDSDAVGAGPTGGDRSGRKMFGRDLAMLVVAQALVGALLPRLVMSRPVDVAVMLAVAVNLVLVAIAYGSGRRRVGAGLR